MTNLLLAHHDLTTWLWLGGGGRCGLGRGVGGLGGPGLVVDARWRLLVGQCVGMRLRAGSGVASSGRGPLQQACAFTAV
jgi:hypothetical protein